MLAAHGYSKTAFSFAWISMKKMWLSFWQWSLSIPGLVPNKSCKQELISKNLDT